MQFGLPVLASDTAVLNEVYDNAAIYFDPLNPDDIAEKMKLLAQDEQFYQRMQERSIERYRLFDWEETAKQTLSIYRAAVGKKNFEPEEEPI
jgi:glycosyltransferase involved in cell wall biosynthesis